MSNYEHFRKLAKRYVRWHRDGHFPVAAAIREGLPPFDLLTDRQILDHPFKLADAQELVARQAGYVDWQALKKETSAMTAKPSPTEHSTLLGAEPQIFVTDMTIALTFYQEKLGFTVGFSYGEPPFYAQVARDGAKLNLRHVDRLPADPALAAKHDLLATMIVLDHAKPLFLEYQATGVEIHQSLRTEPWGARTFIVKDPDGNLIAFAADAN